MMETFSFIIILAILIWTAYVLLRPEKKEEDPIRRSINRKIDEENRAADRSRDFG